MSSPSGQGYFRVSNMYQVTVRQVKANPQLWAESVMGLYRVIGPTCQKLIVRGREGAFEILKSFYHKMWSGCLSRGPPRPQDYSLQAP